MSERTGRRSENRDTLYTRRKRSIDHCIRFKVGVLRLKTTSVCKILPERIHFIYYADTLNNVSTMTVIGRAGSRVPKL